MGVSCFSFVVLKQKSLIVETSVSSCEFVFICQFSKTILKSQETLYVSRNNRRIVILDFWFLAWIITTLLNASLWIPLSSYAAHIFTYFSGPCSLKMTENPLRHKRATSVPPFNLVTVQVTIELGSLLNVLFFYRSIKIMQIHNILQDNALIPLWCWLIGDFCHKMFIVNYFVK